MTGPTPTPGARAGDPAARPRRAMVLAAGLGTRMRPLTDALPKPLITVDGRALIDHVLDRLAAACVETAIVNVHYLADAIERHLAGRRAPRVVISDERDALLDTGGGLARALPRLGDAPFYLMNSDTVWIDAAPPNLDRLAVAFDATRMDALLLLAPTQGSIGYAGRGDFTMAADARLARRGKGDVAAFVYAGAAILTPAFCAGAPAGAFSMNRLFDRAIAAGRLFGLALTGQWMHVGTPEAIAAAQAALNERRR